MAVRDILFNRIPVESTLTQEQLRIAGAHHEAGHAIVATLAGIIVASVEITENLGDGGAAHSGYAALDGPTARQRLDDFAAAMLAGHAAEAHWRRTHRLPIEGTAPHDWKIAQTVCAEAGHRISRAQVAAEAERRVERHWRQITAVAEQLRKARRLTGDQVARIAHIPNPRPAKEA